MPYVDAARSVLGQQEAYLAASNSPKHSDSLKQEDFLTLLVAQLTHQDPMNPMEDSDMTAQMAQFSSLEQLTSINQSVKDLKESLSGNDLLSAVSFIGKEVKADGYNISLDTGDASTIYYGFGETVTKITMNIYDKDGAIVRTVDLGSKEAGTYQYKWDGKNESGTLLPDGTYGVGILGTDLEGGPVLVQTEISGEVDAVVNEGGTQYLRLKDGRYLNFANITEVVNPGAPDVVPPDDGQDGQDGK
ncbi:flagellar hook assembly protein FlgD [Pseudodesulfovibrio sp.]|uniref:flagellar hook assembly protein FlgD n=1 Tax=unclassified Pseudodesulfovibrio TaxID=2661612 RepID=UPI003B003CC6